MMIRVHTTSQAAHDACQEQLTQAQRALQQQQAHSAQTHHALDCAKHQVWNLFVWHWKAPQWAVGRIASGQHGGMFNEYYPH